MGSRTRLTKVQRELLADFQSSQYGDLKVHPRYRRTAEVLVRLGFLKPAMGWGWYEITEAGRSWFRDPREAN